MWLRFRRDVLPLASEFSASVAFFGARQGRSLREPGSVAAADEAGAEPAGPGSARLMRLARNARGRSQLLRLMWSLRGRSRLMWSLRDRSRLMRTSIWSSTWSLSQSRWSLSPSLTPISRCNVMMSHPQEFHSFSTDAQQARSVRALLTTPIRAYSPARTQRALLSCSGLLVSTRESGCAASC